MNKIPAFILFLFFPSIVLGEPLSAPPAFPKDQPIQTRMNLGLFGLLGGGMDYQLGGRPITRYEDFKALIYAQGDREASDLIREAHETHLTAWLFYGAGTATGVDVALAFKPAPLLKVDWIDRIATGFVAAQFFWAAGALFDTNAESRKYNAVQRYNHLLKNEEDAFLGVSTSTPLNGQGLCLGLERAF